MTRLGLLHTVPALAGSFDDMLKGSGAEVVHVVDAGLLTAAIDHGVDDASHAEVLRHVKFLADDGVDAVLVTCSSIGEAVDAAAAQLSIPVLRVDEPMAREAVAIARAAAAGSSAKVAVLATLEATLGPTGRLLKRAVAEAGGGVEVTASVVADAAAARGSGDQARHDDLIRAAAVDAVASADVLVLAQASMAGAVEGLDLGVPVLTSPAGGVAALLDAARTSA